MLAEGLLGAALGYWLGHASPWPWAVMVLCAAAVPVGVMKLVTLYSALKSRAAEPVHLWWRSLWGETVAGVVIFVLRQPWTFKKPGVLPPTGGATKIPVVLVHGFLCNHRIWDDVSDALRKQGHTVIAINLEPLFTSIDRYAPLVEDAVEALCRATSAKQVALVGHSMGGIAIRAWMRAHGTQRCARAITLGTPHQGTEIAENYGFAPNGLQMQWHSPWLTALAASESEATRQLFSIALSPQDNIVFPQRAQTLPNATVKVFDGLGHLQLCLAPNVITWVTQQLDE
jgi:triacylglycerol esterase/lipase EstA (alpha/beta hydrolase family)